MADTVVHSCACPHCQSGQDHPRPATAPPDQPPDEPPGRATTPLVCCPGVQQGRLRGRYPVRTHHRPARRYHSTRPRGVGCPVARAAQRPCPPARRRPTAQGKKDPAVLEDLKQRTEPATGGDPMTQDKFVRRSLRQLSDELAVLGHEACPTTVADLLRGLGYNLRVNRKRHHRPLPPRPRPAVWLYRDDDRGVPDRGTAHPERRHQEKGVGGQLRQRRRGVAGRTEGSQRS